eukprot:364275-Chlamydomonas_euryale.AAC.3
MQLRQGNCWTAMNGEPNTVQLPGGGGAQHATFVGRREPSTGQLPARREASTPHLSGGESLAQRVRLLHSTPCSPKQQHSKSFTTRSNGWQEHGGLEPRAVR